MKLSTKGRYAITAVMAVALGQDKKPVTLAEISEEQGISISYLEQIFARLRKSGIVRGTRGPGGGYCLAKSPNDINMAEIVTAVEDQARIKRPLSGGLPGGQANNESINTMWNNLSTRIQLFLRDITLAEYIEQESEQEAMAPTHATTANVAGNKARWVS